MKTTKLAAHTRKKTHRPRAPDTSLLALREALQHTNNKSKRKPKHASGVDAIIAYLVKNRKSIGAMVVAVAPLANRQVPEIVGNGDALVDGCVASADLVHAVDAEERASMGVRGLLAHGLVSLLNKRLVG